MKTAQARNKELCALYRSGAARGALAVRYGISVKTVANILSRMGMLRRAMTPAMMQKANRLYQAGATRSELAAAFGVSRSTIDAAVKPVKRGLKRLKALLPVEGPFDSELAAKERARLQASFRRGSISEVFCLQALEHIAAAEMAALART